MRRVVPLVLGLLAQACGGTPSESAPCTSSLPVDAFKELMIVDNAVVRDPRTLNASNGPWSFRYSIESMAPQGADPGEFVRQWFVDQWANQTAYNSYPLDPQLQDQQSRTQQMGPRVVCPWYRRTPANGCNADCSMCTATPPKLDLAQAPFRLSAIINRMDLQGQPDIGGSGEARLEFGLTDGAGDDPASAQMPLSIILEYRLPTATGPKDWSKVWHSLGQHNSFDEAYKDQLETLTNRWVGRNASPSSQNGSAIGQVRTDESTLDWIWQLRQFILQADGQLHQTGVRNTPPAEPNGPAEVVAYTNPNAQAILKEKFVLPQTLLAGSADALIYTWTFPGADSKVPETFAQNTCNGCHVRRTMDSAFHITPFRTGVDRLSKFLYDPQNPGTDELTNRTSLF